MTTHAEYYTQAPARRALGDSWLAFLAIVLAGYALFGKGFAYLGYPPIFVGEIALALGVVIAATSRYWKRVFELPETLIVLPLIAWGTYRTLPCYSQYKFDAFRDAVVFGYSAFAFVVAAIILARPQRLEMLINWYRRFWWFFLLAIPVITIIYRFARTQLPTLPGSGVPIIFVKEGDVMVHLAAILAFWVCGFERPIHWGWTLLMAGCVATIGVVDRAGLLAFFAVGVICMIARPRHHASLRLIALCVAAVLALWITDIHIEIPGGKGREVSFRQLAINVQSMLGGETGEHGLDSNRDWRLNWWGDVWDYTVNGPYRWTGKGFGINLADDDGYQLFQDGSLRSPHSAHITFLARSGIPGLLLWFVIPLVWGYGILKSYFQARRSGEDEWQAMFFFIGAFGLALVVNASFDVYLEGPMGGIWFWSVYGLGLAAMWIYRNAPETLSDDEEPNLAAPLAERVS